MLICCEQTFIKPWIENVRKERELKGRLISEVLSHAQSDMVGKLRNEDGTPDKEAIKRSAYLYLCTEKVYMN